ncbi:sigma-54-dependent Fis family transcriptional regulator [Pontibacter qinzhouensis]|uniref:Sigma-54-dependent Fis family transcriptional regulator n=1 Tax=Pontibacter qinzhouensis TaxID=2603253 RepID=A0A5C8J780_9BACT|nr:sigma-54 dependent transcriptional regulator [Pontibacter qinzhouensis]TXK33795.1 sigma-54-dependent Fis family transcriptional regulator [Pontibacter qinzhouensis]
MSVVENLPPTTIFVLEDDLWYSQFLSYHLSLNPDHRVEVFNDVDSFMSRLHEAPDIVTLDYYLPGYAGETILKKIMAVSPSTYTLVVSGQDDISKAVDLMKQGVHDYIAKNDETKERIWSIVEKIKQNISLKKEIEVLRKEVKQKYSLGTELVGSSEPMQKIFTLVEKASNSNINVTITGETGTGKELIAKAIHQHSNRSNKPFVAVNISAIPSELLESELFGHEKGSFTGATHQRIGKFEEANGGTLFLDEIGEMNINLQSKLLRILQEREVTRIGAKGTVAIDVRILTATHRNLIEEVKKGNFREDLYYRLLGIQVHLPPLRERGHDLLLIAQKLLADFCLQNDMTPKRISPDAQKVLLKHTYPGNVRELKAVVELAAVLSDKDVISPEDIQLPEQKQDLQTSPFPEEKTLDEYIAETVQKYLDKYNYNVLSVADKLKIGKSTIYRMIRKREVYLADKN